ncbi:MAG TPA: VCBS repeat-containing protein, partial [Planctomycetota bacterium]|nr:VCBS repeat-containing protein [Planctomycetota bacterium]
SLGSFAIADFNLDGKLDFASATFYTAGFGVLLGSGGGAFGAPTLFMSGTSTDAVAAGDLNSDGAPDVALLDTGSELVRPWLGNGTGTFAAGTTLKTRPDPFGLAVGDVSGDGRADVVITESFTDKVRVYVGSPTGFLPTDLYIAGSDPQLITIGDFDSDGHMDIAVANVGSNNVTLLHGTTATPTGCSSYGTGTSGCSGLLGINANQTPAVNTPTFALTQTNAPPDKIGLCLIANVQDLAGSDPLALGFLLHVNLGASTFFIGLNFDSDGVGAGISSVPIPNNPSLSGATVFAQGLWLENINETCSPSPLGVVTSKGLSVTIQ